MTTKPGPTIGVGMAISELPEYRHSSLPVIGIVAARELGRLRDQLRLAVALEDRRRRPRGNLFALRAPHFLAGRDVERREERAALDVALHDHHVLPDDRRAADAPLVVGVEEPAGVEDAEVLLPEQLAVEVVGVKPLRAERHDHARAVGHRRRRRLARLRDGAWSSACPRTRPCPTPPCRCLVERDETPGVLRRVGDRLDVAVLAGADALRWDRCRPRSRRTRGRPRRSGSRPRRRQPAFSTPRSRRRGRSTSPPWACRRQCRRRWRRGTTASSERTLRRRRQ